MTPEEIASLEPALAEFLDRFADCFGRSEPRGNLATYVRGQLSGLDRKSVEPIALEAGAAPRTLQKFLAQSKWDEGKMRDRIQQIVAIEHADPDPVLIIDETSFAKKGTKTPGVQRQHCGSRGKIDNCVVTVHTSYHLPSTRFQTLIDSDLYLPEHGWDDPDRRAEAHIPDDVVYRPKWKIALEQIDRILGNRIKFEWVTADEHYGSKPGFLDALEKRKLHFVVEVPRNTYGWFIPPVTVAGTRTKRVDNLCRFSECMNRQPWTRYTVKDTDKGPVVWEFRCHPFWTRRKRRIVGPYVLMIARNVLAPEEVKYFLIKAPEGTPIEKFIAVAFSRFPIERCFEDGKTELGFDHFEVRSYPGLIRHCHITALTLLFLARMRSSLAKKKPGDHALPSPDGGRRGRLGDRDGAGTRGPNALLRQDR